MKLEGQCAMITGAASGIGKEIALTYARAGAQVAIADLDQAAVQLAGQAAALSGVGSVAAGVFDRADAWAFDAMRWLGRDPRAGLRLHEKLVAQGAADNAFLLDAARLERMRALAAGLAPEARGAGAVQGPGAVQARKLY